MAASLAGTQVWRFTKGGSVRVRAGFCDRSAQRKLLDGEGGDARCWAAGLSRGARGRPTPFMLRSGRICTEAIYVNERGLRATFVGATGPQDRRLAMVQMHQPGSAHGHNFRRAQPVAAPSEIAAPTSAPRGAENPTDRPSFRALCRQRLPRISTCESRRRSRPSAAKRAYTSRASRGRARSGMAVKAALVGHCAAAAWPAAFCKDQIHSSFGGRDDAPSRPMLRLRSAHYFGITK